MKEKKYDNKMEDDLQIIDHYSVVEKIIYTVFIIIGYIYGYITLIPHYIRHYTFKNIHLNDIPSICVSDSGREEKIYRKKSTLNGLIVGYPNIHVLSDIIKYASEKYAERYCLGKRKVIDKQTFINKENGKLFKKYHLGSYQWKTYQQVGHLVEKFKIGLYHIDIWNDSSPPKIAIFSKNSEQWVISAFGIFSTGAILVTVFSNMDDSSIIYAFNQTKPSIVIVDKASLKRIESFIHHMNFCLKSIIVIGKKVEQCEAITSKGINMVLYDEVIQYGDNKNKNCAISSYLLPDSDDLAVIMYTSGSSGRPKGVCLTHKNIITTVGSVPRTELIEQIQTTPYYLPCSHTLGLGYMMVALIYGYKIGHCRPFTLFDNSPGVMDGTRGDFTELQPTASFVVPIIIDRLTKGVIANVKHKPRCIQLLFDFSLKYKIYFLKMGHNSAPIIDKFLFSKIKSIIGGRLNTVYSGGSSISGDISLIFSAMFGVNLKQVYGTTESFGGGTFTDLDAPFSIDAGTVSPTVEIKLVPWPEGNYFPDDKPNPRGEICIHGACVAKSYYELEEETRKKFKHDDKNKIWYYTGDIAEYLPNGNFSIIDRKENIIKLTNGEFVSLARVESCIYNSDFVEICCCIPSLNNDHLVAIINPRRNKILDLITSHKIATNGDISQHINDQAIRNAIIDDIKLRMVGLSKYEIPNKYIITADQWTPENEMLTSVFKIRRYNIKKRYQHLL